MEMFGYVCQHDRQDITPDCEKLRPAYDDASGNRMAWRRCHLRSLPNLTRAIGLNTTTAFPDRPFTTRHCRWNRYQLFGPTPGCQTSLSTYR